jgi:hypothetical protein
MSLVVGVVEGGPKHSPLTPLMIAAGVAVHLLLVVGSALDEASSKSSPGLVSVSTTAASSGVVVLLGGVVGMLLAWSLSSM